MDEFLPGGRADGSRFQIVRRGYDRQEVDTLVARAGQAVTSDSETVRAEALGTLRAATFHGRFRGYAPLQVNQAIQRYLDQLS